MMVKAKHLRRLSCLLLLVVGGLSLLAAGAPVDDLLAAVEGVDDPVILVFYQTDCPDCALVEELLEGLITDLPETAVRRYEISEPGVLDLLAKLESAYEVEADSVPAVFAGDDAIIGIDRTQEFLLRDTVSRCALQGCPSPLLRVRPEPFPWDDLLRLAGLALVLALLAIVQIP